MKKNISNSNPEDLVLGLIFGGFPNNLLTLARSIRSSGCNDTVVILACEGIISEFDEEYIQSLNNCGINLVPIPNFYHRVQKIHGNLLRHAFFSIFLKKYARFFNRVVVLDVYDTYFQIDPFTPNFPKSKVYFSYEALKFKNNDVNNAWVKLLDSSYTYEKYMNLYPLCSELFFGYIGNLVKFYDIFVNITHWQWVGYQAQDQGTLNSQFYTGKFGDLVDIDLNRTFVSCTGHKLSNLVSNSNFPRYDDGIVPKVFHQYDRLKETTEFIQNHCPTLGSWQRDPYGRYDYSSFEW